MNILTKVTNYKAHIFKTFYEFFENSFLGILGQKFARDG
jgi:hypothetical protein